MLGQEQIGAEMNEYISELRDLIWVWDPMGIADARDEIPGEYDSFAADLLRALRLAPQRSTLEDWTHRTLADLGVREDPERDSDFVVRAWELVSSVR